MSELLFDTPWWLPVAIGVLGFVLFVTGNRRVENRVRLAGLGVIALAVLLVVVSYLVDTPRETAERRTRELVKAFEAADWATMSSILAPNSAVTVLNATIYSDRKEILKAAKQAHERYGFKRVNILTSTAEQAQTVITVTVVLLSDQAGPVGTLNSQWQFEWQETAEGWILVEVRALKIGQMTGDQIRPMFPGGK